MRPCAFLVLFALVTSAVGVGCSGDEDKSKAKLQNPNQTFVPADKDKPVSNSKVGRGGAGTQ